MGKASDKARADRIVVLCHDDGDCESCGFGGAGHCRSTCDDDVVVARPEVRELAEREGLEGVRGALAELVEKSTAGGEGEGA